MNRGGLWSGVLLQVANATNPALAISTAGKIGLLYQQLTGAGGNQRWETHFRDSTNGTIWSDTLLAATPANAPVKQTDPYLGDYIDLVAVGKNFYGVFCANNTPDPANFPTVMPAYLRNIDQVNNRLLGSDNVTVINASIDPFFLKAIEVPTSSDFYVRDWTDTATSGDDGTEPSTHWDFWNQPDVWNQFSSNVAFPSNANDQPQSENAQAGADNHAFARIRRNALPAAGSGSTTVSAHFLVSEFGTGSNFVDWVFNDPTDPDVTFPTPTDVSVTFNETDLGPLVTSPFTWSLGPTTSDHLCLAVEINAAGDPMSAPGLTGRAPGSSAATFAVVNDNNKAQRNLLVNMALTHIRGATYYGIVHNAATSMRDMLIGVAVPRGLEALPEGTTVEIVTDKGIVERRPWRPWDRITFAAMTPGENRWIGVNLPVRAGAAAPAVSFVELKGDRPVNGFSIAARPAFVIGDLSTVWLTAFVRETDASNVSVGQDISFRVLAAPGRTYHARINYVASAFDPATRRLLVRATVDNKDGVLKPEMFANVTLYSSGDLSKVDMLGIPRNAVIYEGDVSRVWVARDDQSIELRQVKLGLTNGKRVQVLAGARLGEKVITKGSLFIDRAATGS